MALLGNPNFLAFRPKPPYQIEQSLRFESGDTHYLNRTPGSAGNRKTWTFSCWFKRPKVTQSIFFISGGFSGGGATQADFRIRLRSDSDSIEVANAISNGNTFTVHGSPKFRDPSAWYHLVVAMDTTQSTASDRVKIWVNGEQITAFATSDYPSLNEEPLLNTALVHRIGAWDDSGSVYSPTSPYLAEMYHVDGTALDHEDFGKYDTNGVWRPIQPAISSYGTTGFYLNFSNSSNLGEDQAGSNDWTANNFTTSGTGTDVMSDTPTTNWATLNPLDPIAVTFSEGNLKAAGQSNWETARSTIAMTTGKWYWEVTPTFTHYSFMGVVNKDADLTKYVGQDANGWGWETYTPATVNNSSYTNYGTAPSSGDVIGFAFDADTGKLWIRNASGFFSGDPEAGTTPALTASGGEYYVGVSGFYSHTANTCNFGQRDFSYTPPTNFLPLNTSNLPEPDIADGSDYFQSVLYSGTGSSQDITVADNSGNGWQPDLVWMKVRDDAFSHHLNDAVRGAGERLQSNSTGAEETKTDALTSFNSDGFTVISSGETNQSGKTYVAWNWLAGNGTSTPSGGSIASTVSANPTAGFSIVTYTGNGTSGATVAHGLGVKPSFYVVKRRDSSTDWAVYHASEGATKYLSLNNTNTSQSSSAYWNNTEPTSTVFSLGVSGEANTSSATFVAYCFAEVEGYSKFGKFDTNNTSDNTFVYLGFKPAMIIVKIVDTAADNWLILDNKRNNTTDFGGNPIYEKLEPSTSSAASTATNTEWCDFLSNGFKVRTNNGQIGGGPNYIYAAFAEHPTGGSGVSPATAR